MNVFIVHAHHEPKSFCSAMAKQAEKTLTNLGHTVAVSDLHEMDFDPISDRRNFVTTKDATYLKQQAEETFATENDGFSKDIENEMQKLESADLLIFNFPLWWFGMPAILKGWADRVLAAGRIYGGSKLYEGGIGGGEKRAMVMMTTGGGESAYDGWGVNPELNTILAPIHHGIFWFNGYRPVEPFVAWSPARIGDENRKAILANLEKRIERVFDDPARIMPPLADFPNFGTDKKNRFHVVVKFIKDFDDEFYQLVPAEQSHLANLQHEGKLVEMSRTQMNDPTPRVFLTFRAADQAEVEQWMRDLPLHDYLEFEISQIAKPKAS